MKAAIHCLILILSHLFIAFAQENQDYKYLIRQAIDNDNLNYALQLYSFAVEDDYYDLECLQRMTAEIYYRQNNYIKTYEICKKLYNEDETDNLTDLIYMCMLCNGVNKNDSLISEIAKRMGENTLDKNLLQRIKILSQKDVEKVIATINRRIVKDNVDNTQNIEAYKTILTILFYTNGHYTDAYNTSIDYLTMNNQPIIHYILGILRQKRGEYSSARSFFSLAIKNGYKHYDAFLQCAVCKGYEGDYISANSDLDTCLTIDSNYYVFYLKGINYCHLHDYQTAMINFDYSITLNDTFAESYNYRGIALSNLHEYAFAVIDFKHAIALNKKTPFVHNNLGIALENSGKLTEAMEEYKLSTKYEPYFEGGWYNLGRIYTNFKMISKAIRYLQKAMDINAEIPDIYYLLGVNYQNDNNKKKACEYYNIALEMNHTEVQDKIDNYCNKNTEEVIERKENNEENSDDKYEDSIEQNLN